MNMVNKKIKICLAACLLTASMWPGETQAQEQPSAASKVENYIRRNEYANAIKVLVPIASKKNPSTLNLERLADSYLYLKQYESAENWYARVVQRTDYKKESLLNYAEALKQNGKYREAKVQFQKYESEFGALPEVTLAIAGADSALIWLEKPTGHVIRNEERLNTDKAEFGAFPTQNLGLLYTAEPTLDHKKRSGMTGESYLKIFSTEQGAANVGLDQGKQVAGLFNEAAYHVGPVISNKEGDVLFVTRTYPGADAERYRAYGKTVKRKNLELKIYKKDSNRWIEVNFPYNNVKEYSLGHAALSADEQTLYFASDMPGGLGGVDIWYSELQSDGSWGKPQNAGAVINSAGDEMFPAVYGDEFYFSSNGFAGMGGLDIFRAKGAKSNFSGRENLRFPINSAGDDFAFVVSHKDEHEAHGYLASNRSGGKGNDDIYSFGYVRPKITIRLEGLTINKKTKDLLPGATVSLFAANRQLLGKVQSDGSALFTFPIEENENYKLFAEKEGFHADSLRVGPIKANKDTVVKVTLALEPVFTVGDKFVLENIYYDFDKHNIRPDAALVLDQLVRTMRDNPTLKIELSSHTDSRGNDNYNMALSQRRAQAAVDYIISQGIDRDRLVARGYGETRLINHCGNGVKCSDDEHQANRRTEVEVLAF